MMKTWDFLLPAVPLKIFLVILACGVCGSVSSTVVINEVYYDHPGRDTGFEFIELYCTGETEISLEGWSLALIDGRTGGSRELWHAGQGMVIRGGGLILIGGDSCVVTPDGLLTGAIENGPDAVVLLCDGEEIDLVPYGGDDPGCSQGVSLSRRPDGVDSDDTGRDFVCGPPTPGSRNFHDIDLSIAFDRSLHVHCEYEVTDVTVLLSNRGIEDYSGIVILTVTSAGAGFRETVGSRQFHPVLNPGEDQAVSAGCIGIPHGNTILEIRIEAEGDTNRSNDSVSLGATSSPGDVVISEIMYRPAGGGEWIELFNRSADSVDLSGWTVTDRAGASGSISDDVEIGAGGYLILAQDPRGMVSEFPACRIEVTSLEDRWPRLNDGGGDGTAEEIFVRNRDGIMAESVSYRSMIIDEKGRSIERLSPELCSAGRDGIWLRCGSSAGATPGERNYCHTVNIPSSGMSVSPDPFCPGIDGTVRFSAAAAAGETSYGASLFDMEGRKVARLASGPVGAPAVSFGWDGRDEKGRPVMTGLYICVVEFKCGGGGVCRREKGIVRVWAGQR